MTDLDKRDKDLAEARDCIASLLARIDDYAGPGMHWYGQTPDWYVKAAMISCGIEND